MTITILLCSIVIFLCLLCRRLSFKLGVPALLLFILLGMLFGSDGIFRIPFENYAFAEQICSAALIFIMFYGGFGTKWETAKPVAVVSVLLSTVGVFITAALTGLFCHFVLHIAPYESFLIGAVISSTDAASVFSILRSKKLALKNNTDSLLELESGSNDPCSYMLTIIALNLMRGQGNAGQILYLLAAQLLLGLLCGVVIGFAAIWLLQHHAFGQTGAVFATGVALLAYALPSLIGGNGYLSTYLAGILLGNAQIPSKKALVQYFDDFTSLMQMFIFFLLGLLAQPSLLPSIFLPALLIALFLTFVSRPIAVFAILSPTRRPFRQQLLVSFCGLRGAASIVFAIMVTVSDAYTKNDVFHIVFCIVLLSIAFQGSLIAPVARRLNMVDAHGDVRRTFSDYSSDIDIQFIQLSIHAGHPWENHAICELSLPPDTLIVMLQRNGQAHAPDGNAVLLYNDIVVLSALAYCDTTNTMLIERDIHAGSSWHGKTIADFSPNSGELIILIRRAHENIIPHGNTVLQSGDRLVIYKSSQ